MWLLDHLKVFYRSVAQDHHCGFKTISAPALIGGFSTQCLWYISCSPEVRYTREPVVCVRGVRSDSEPVLSV